MADYKLQMIQKYTRNGEPTMIRRYSNCLITGALALIGLVVLPALEAAAETIVVYGASGRVGGVIVAEALARGHDVVGVSRDPAGFTNDHPNFSAIAGDVTSPESMLDVIPGTDVVIFSLRGIGPGNTPEEATTAVAAATFIQVAGQLGDAAPHVVQIGGGISLWIDGVWGLDDPTLEEGTSRHGQYFGHYAAIEAYRASDGVQWTVMSPPPSEMAPGERTGEYRLGLEEVLFDAEGSSFISTEDFAIAVIDEAETGQSMGKRVAVGPPH
jgi:putative NADH-flavin reductase